MAMRKTKKELTTYGEAFSFALDKLSYRDYSQEELEGKLQECSCPFPVIQAVIAKLKECKYLNEERYAEGIYRSWLGKKYYGRLHLKQYLGMKFVHPDYQKELLASFTREEEAKRAHDFLSSKWKSLQKKYKDDEMKLKAAAARSLASRGFGGDLVWSTIEHVQNMQK